MEHSLDEKGDEMKINAVLPRKALLERITVTYRVDGKRRYSTCKLRTPLDTDLLAIGDHFEIIYRITKEEI